MNEKTTIQFINRLKFSLNKKSRLYYDITYNKSSNKTANIHSRTRIKEQSNFRSKKLSEEIVQTAQKISIQTKTSRKKQLNFETCRVQNHHY